MPHGLEPGFETLAYYIVSNCQSIQCAKRYYECILFSAHQKPLSSIPEAL